MHAKMNVHFRMTEHEPFFEVDPYLTNVNSKTHAGSALLTFEIPAEIVATISAHIAEKTRPAVATAVPHVKAVARKVKS